MRRLHGVAAQGQRVVRRPVAGDDEADVLQPGVLDREGDLACVDRRVHQLGADDRREFADPGGTQLGVDDARADDLEAAGPIRDVAHDAVDNPCVEGAAGDLTVEERGLPRHLARRRHAAFAEVVADDIVAIQAVLGLLQLRLADNPVPVDARIARPLQIAEAEPCAFQLVVAEDEAVRSVPDERLHYVLLHDEVLPAARQELVVGIDPEDVAPERQILHHVPAVFGVERASRELPAAVDELAPLHQHVVEASQSHADASDVDMLDVDEGAVVGRAEVKDREMPPRRRVRHRRAQQREAGEGGVGARAEAAVHVPLHGLQVVSVGVVEVRAIRPAVRRVALVAEIASELDEAAVFNKSADVGEPHAREAVGGGHGDALSVEIARLELAHGLRAVETVAVARHRAVARDVADGHVAHGAVRRPALEGDAADPLRMDGGVREVAPDQVALNGAVDEVRVDAVLEDDHPAGVDLVLHQLERAAVHVEGHAANHPHAVRAVDGEGGACGEHDFSVAVRLGPPQQRRQPRRRLDGMRVVRMDAETGQVGRQHLLRLDRLLRRIDDAELLEEAVGLAPCAIRRLQREEHVPLRRRGELERTVPGLHVRQRRLRAIDPVVHGESLRLVAEILALRRVRDVVVDLHGASDRDRRLDVVRREVGHGVGIDSGGCQQRGRCQQRGQSGGAGDGGS